MDYLSESEADAAVIQSLLSEIKILRGKKPMSDLLKLADGRIVEAEEVRVISDDDIRGRIDELHSIINSSQDEITKLTGMLTEDSSQSESQPVPTEQPATAAIEAPSTPINVSTPALPQAPAQPAPTVNDVTPNSSAPRPLQLG